jgi:hypothetical protein
MLITTGTVHGGTIQVDAKSLPKGATITVLAAEGHETCELSSEEEVKLFAAIAEAERGETTNAAQILAKLGDA